MIHMNACDVFIFSKIEFDARKNLEILYEQTRRHFFYISLTWEIIRLFNFVWMIFTCVLGIIQPQHDEYLISETNKQWCAPSCEMPPSISVCVTLTTSCRLQRSRNRNQHRSVWRGTAYFYFSRIFQFHLLMFTINRRSRCIIVNVWLLHITYSVPGMRVVECLFTLSWIHTCCFYRHLAPCSHLWDDWRSLQTFSIHPIASHRHSSGKYQFGLICSMVAALTRSIKKK